MIHLYAFLFCQNKTALKAFPSLVGVLFFRKGNDGKTLDAQHQDESRDECDYMSQQKNEGGKHFVSQITRREKEALCLVLCPFLLSPLFLFSEALFAMHSTWDSKYFDIYSWWANSCLSWMATMNGLFFNAVCPFFQTRTCPGTTCWPRPSFPSTKPLRKPATKSFSCLSKDPTWRYDLLNTIFSHHHHVHCSICFVRSLSFALYDKWLLPGVFS